MFPENATLDYEVKGTFVNVYDFYQVVEGIVSYPDGLDGGRASGNETVAFRAYGLDPDLQQYALRFTSTEYPSRTLKTPHLFQPNDTTYIEFTTPHWGALYPYGNTTVEFLSSDVPISSVVFSVTTDGRDDIYFRWDQEWIKTDLAIGPASGGTVIVVSGHGFDVTVDRPDLEYICRFNDPDPASDYQMDSLKATVLSPTALRCTTPPWGDNYSWLDNGAALSLLQGPRERALPGPSGTPDDPSTRYGPPVYFEFFPMWSYLQYDNAFGAKGDEPLVISGSGLRTSANLYKCEFEGLDGDGVFRQLVSLPATAHSTTNVTCRTPIWGDYFKAMNTTVRLYEVDGVESSSTRSLILGALLKLVRYLEPEAGSDKILNGAYYRDTVYEFYQGQTQSLPPTPNPNPPPPQYNSLLLRAVTHCDCGLQASGLCEAI